jgi:pimeloyl-ACP methyl ester carboxylesterase
MANFVLVPGFWLGGWAWKNVTEILRGDGHEVFPVTLTGLGEKVHLGSEQTNLDTHIADVLNLIKYNELEDVYLAGHSYGGVVITAVADQIPEKIAKLIYVDSAPLPDGSALVDFYPPERRKAFEKSVAENGDGWLLPLPLRDSPVHAENLKDVDDEMWERFERMATSQPFNVSLQKLNLKNSLRKSLPKLAIFSVFSIAQVKEMINSGSPLFQELADPNFEFVELPTGHYPMFSRPAELADLLIEAAEGN